MTLGFTDSRRGFLKRAFWATTAVAAGGAICDPARGGEVGRRVDVVKPLDLGGVWPAEHVVGGVLICSEDYDYLTFDAQHVADGNGAGRAVIRLTECVDRRFRTDGDQHLIDGLDPSELSECRVYEVTNSTWVPDLIDDDPSLVGPRSPELHHCVVTFRETNLECVIFRYDLLFYDGPFDELNAKLIGD